MRGDVARYLQGKGDLKVCWQRYVTKGGYCWVAINLSGLSVNMLLSVVLFVCLFLKKISISLWEDQGPITEFKVLNTILGSMFLCCTLTSCHQIFESYTVLLVQLWLPASTDHCRESGATQSKIFMCRASKNSDELLSSVGLIFIGSFNSFKL